MGLMGRRMIMKSKAQETRSITGCGCMIRGWGGF